MRIKNNVLVCVICCSLMFVSSCISQKNKTAVINEIKNLVDKSDYKFLVQRVNPMRTYMMNTNQINLGNDYYLSVKKDTIDCYLPYFGVSNVAPTDIRKMGIEFTSTQFNLDKTLNNNGSYDIKININDHPQTSQLYLHISENGFATLSVTQNTRDAISYSGIIEKNP